MVDARDRRWLLTREMPNHHHHHPAQQQLQKQRSLVKLATDPNITAQSRWNHTQLNSLKDEVERKHSHRR